MAVVAVVAEEEVKATYVYSAADLHGALRDFGGTL